jgi:3alpha(or 20beta)-hydroxysteroid dehydrogenase
VRGVIIADVRDDDSARTADRLSGMELPLAEWNLIQQVNATSVLLGIQAVADTMARQGAAALELAPHGIRVNSISPRWRGHPDERPRTGRRHLVRRAAGPARCWAGALLGRRARPEEISPLVVFLASAGASYVTGADYLTDGGVTIR